MHASRHPARGHSSYKGPKLTDTVEEIVGKDHGDLRPSGRAEEGAASGACGGPDHVLSQAAAAAARHARRSLLRRRSPVGGGPQGARVDPPPQVGEARSRSGPPSPSPFAPARRKLRAHPRATLEWLPTT